MICFLLDGSCANNIYHVSCTKTPSTEHHNLYGQQELMMLHPSVNTEFEDKNTKMTYTTYMKLYANERQGIQSHLRRKSVELWGRPCACFELQIKPIADLVCICHSLRDKSVRIIFGLFLKCSRQGCCIVLCCSVLTLRFRFQSPCSRWPCQNKGTCVPQYEKNSCVCLCIREFSGKTCQTSKKINVFALIALSKKNRQKW